MGIMKTQKRTLASIESIWASASEIGGLLVAPFTNSMASLERDSVLQDEWH